MGTEALKRWAIGIVNEAGFDANAIAFKNDLDVTGVLTINIETQLVTGVSKNRVPAASGQARQLLSHSEAHTLVEAEARKYLSNDAAHIGLLSAVKASPESWARMNGGGMAITTSETFHVIDDCETCQAKGEVQCATCNGKADITCDGCRGETTITCSTCRGRPFTDCLMCDAKGYPRCTRCSGNGHYLEWGYDHKGNSVSEYRMCTQCGTSGRSSWPCSYCEGKGKNVCRNCAGHGKVRCDRCSATGRVRCSRCSATGRVTCDPCSGIGRFRTDYSSYVSATTSRSYNGMDQMAEFNEVVGRNIEFIEKDSSFTPQVTAASLEGHTVKASFRVSVPFSAITVVTPVKEHRLRLLGAGRRLLARPKIAEDLLLPVIEKLEAGQAGKAHDLIEQLSRSKLGRLIAVTAAGSLPEAEASQLRGMITDALFERAVVAVRHLLAGATLPLRRRFWWRAVATLSFFPFLSGLVAFLFPPPGVVLTQDGETLFWLALALASTILPWVTALVAFKLKSRQWTKKLVNTDQVEAMDIGGPGVAALILPILLFSAICYGLYEFSGTAAYTEIKVLIWKAVTDLLAV